MKMLLLAVLLPVLGTGVPEDESYTDSISTAVVTAARAGEDTPVSVSDVKKKSLRSAPAATSLPQALGMLPGVVANCEGGSGLGYTNLRVRGVGGMQTGVSLNGIMLNDAESQEVFWVNIPGLNGILESVQLQRGLGVSSAGAGAFGAAVNMETGSAPPLWGIRGDASISYGSFGTFTASASGDGACRNGFFARAALNKSLSDGYMTGGSADVQSAFAQLGWSGTQDSFSLMLLSSHQKTGITWEGCPWDRYDKDRRYNPAAGAFDNYSQTHIQGRYQHKFSPSLSWENTLNFTHGSGWYEYPAAISWAGADTRDAVDNNLYVLRSELAFKGGAFRSSAGIYLSNYIGLHYGTKTADALSVQLYSNSAVKRELDAWTRTEYQLGTAVLFADLQFRSVAHLMDGPDEYGTTLAYNCGWNFLNPRAGVTFNLPAGNRLFGSLALSHREPARADIQSALRSTQEVRPESLLDLEAGWSLKRPAFDLSLTLYNMSYKDMLIETAILDQAGYPVKTNVPGALRRGIELSFDMNSDGRRPSLNANIGLSRNKYREGKVQKDILLSPSVTAGIVFNWIPWKGSALRLMGKYVGRQYWDNSGDENHVVPAYYTVDGSFGQSFNLSRKPGGPRLELRLDVANILNRNYYAYAYTGGVFPAAPRSVSLTAKFHFGN